MNLPKLPTILLRMALAACLVLGPSVLQAQSASTQAEEGYCAQCTLNGCTEDYHLLQPSSHGNAFWLWGAYCIYGSCPRFAHCHGSSLLPLSDIIDQVLFAVSEGTSEALLSVARLDNYVRFNPDRGALQVVGCVEGSIAAHIPLSPRQVAVLRESGAWDEGGRIVLATR